jgi:hypothetical protein
MHVEDEKCIQYFGWKPRRQDHSEDLGVDGRIILEWILREIGWEGVDWLYLAQDRGQ